MARKPRRQVPGMVLHIIIRGNRRQDIFQELPDWGRFEAALLELAQTGEFELLGHCLMTNHAHMIIRCGERPVGKAIQGLLTSHAQYMNRKYGHSGHLYQGRHKEEECRTNEGLKHLLRYVHRNPVRAGMVKKYSDWRWSSHRAYAGAEVPGIRTDFILGLFSSNKAEAQALYLRFMDDLPTRGETATLEPLDALAKTMERNAGFDDGVLRSGRRTAPHSKLRRSFILEGVRLGHSARSLAGYLRCSESYVFATLRKAPAS